MHLQIWISLVMAFGMLETTMLFAHFLHWNDSGSPNLALTIIALFFGVLKRAVSRVLVLLVSMGYSVVRPSLADEMPRVLYLGAAYCLLSLIYTIATSLPNSNKTVDENTHDMISMVVFVLAGVDTTFYIWILTSLNNLITSLAARKQAAKYLLYRNFRSVLVISFVAAIVWALYGSVINLSQGHGEDNNWKDHWTVDALWESTYFMLFLAIAYLWAPSKNSMRYSYAVELSQLENDTEWHQAGLGELEMTESLKTGGGGGGDQHNEKGNEHKDAIDAEYGGRLDDEGDPFIGTGALDTQMAITKKQ